MPTYSYRCSACGHTFDKVQRITEDAIKVCESCGAEAAARLITSGNFMLKGSGWYSDLYSGSSNKKSGGGNDAAPSSASKPSGESASAVPAPAAAPTTAAPASTTSSSSGASGGTPSSST